MRGKGAARPAVTLFAAAPRPTAARFGLRRYATAGRTRSQAARLFFSSQTRHAAARSFGRTAATSGPQGTQETPPAPHNNNNNNNMGNGLFANCLPDASRPPPEEVEEEDELPFAAERKAALKAVARAAFMCRRVQSRLVNESTVEKKDRSPVTVADFAAQALVINELSKAFPYPFIAEEGTKILRENAEVRQQVLEHVQSVLPDMDEANLLQSIAKGKTDSIPADVRLWWTLDPIDGTLGFLRREQYAVALSLLQDGEPVLGVLGCPALPHLLPKTATGDEDDDDAKSEDDDGLGCMFVAVKGQGAWARGLETKTEHRIRVSDVDDVSRAAFTESVESSHSSHDASAQIAKLLGVTAEPIRMDSQCKYAVVARGQASIYLRLSSGNYEEKIWDHAAGYVIVKEAGGEVCDLNGAPLDFSVGRTLKNNKGIVATNGKVHEEVLAAIKAVDPLGNGAKRD